MAVNCSSSGVATVEAIVSGLAPGSCADRDGREIDAAAAPTTGNSVEADDAEQRGAPAISSAVAIGRRMKISEMFMARPGPLGFVGRFDLRPSHRRASRYWPSVDDPLAGRQALGDDGDPIVPGARLRPGPDAPTLSGDDHVDVGAVRSGHDARSGAVKASRRVPRDKVAQ